MNVESLVTMANQIADFFVSEAGPEAAPKEIAAHITKFWAPRMRAQYIEYACSGGQGLQPSALAAASLLTPVQAASERALLREVDKRGQHEGELPSRSGEGLNESRLVGKMGDR